MELVSDDERRSLYEIGNGGIWKVCKYLVLKKDSVIGSHYHKLKDEHFTLLEGSGLIGVGTSIVHVVAPYSFHVPRGIFHKFELSGGSVLLCLASEVHDPNDDYKL